MLLEFLIRPALLKNLPQNLSIPLLTVGIAGTGPFVTMALRIYKMNQQFNSNPIDLERFKTKLNVQSIWRYYRFKITWTYHQKSLATSFYYIDCSKNWTFKKYLWKSSFFLFLNVDHPSMVSFVLFNQSITITESLNWQSNSTWSWFESRHLHSFFDTFRGPLYTSAISFTIECSYFRVEKLLKNRLNSNLRRPGAVQTFFL